MKSVVEVPTIMLQALNGSELLITGRIREYGIYKFG